MDSLCWEGMDTCTHTQREATAWPQEYATILSYALHSSIKCNSAPLFTVETWRLSYVMDTLDTHHGLSHLIRREQLFEDVIEVKINKHLENSRFEFAMTKRKPLTQVVFVETCSVASCWMHTWGHLMVVVCSFQLSIHILTWQSVLGTVLSYGFVVSGFLPIRLTFPVVASTVHGPMVAIPDTIIQSFANYLSS